jgi:hypothetical protein
MEKANIAILIDKKGFSKKLKIESPRLHIYVPFRKDNGAMDTVEFYFVRTVKDKGGSRYIFHEYKETRPDTMANAFVVGDTDRISI